MLEETTATLKWVQTIPFASSAAQITALNNQRDALVEKLVTMETDAGPMPEAWAVAQEALFEIDSRLHRHGQPHLEAALEWWKASTELDRARERYLHLIVRGLWPRGSFPDVQPASMQEEAFTTRQLRDGLALQPQGLLKTALQLAVARNQAAMLDSPEAAAARKTFVAILNDPGLDAWENDIRLEFAEYLARAGQYRFDADGDIDYYADREAAAEQFRQIIQQTTPGSRSERRATAALKNLNEQSLDVSVNNNFRPGERIEFVVSVRNLESVRVSVHSLVIDDPLALGAIGAMGNYRDRPTALKRLSYFAKAKASWSTELTCTESEVFHGQQQNIGINEGLAPGLYLVKAVHKGHEAYDWLLVSDLLFHSRTTANSVEAWFADAFSGQSVPEVSAHLLVFDHDNRQLSARHYTADRSGLIHATIPESDRANRWIMIGRKGDRFAIGGGYSVNHRQNAEQSLAIFVFAGKAAFRPGETVLWRAFVREHSDTGWTTPKSRKVTWSVTGPRSSDPVAEGTAMTNEFGSIEGEIVTGTDWVPGHYRIRFEEDGTYGSESLFQLEPFRLPPFRVTLAEQPTETGYRLGDSIPMEIRAAYYSGSPVADATVQIRLRCLETGEVPSQIEKRTGIDGETRFQLQTDWTSGATETWIVDVTVSDATRSTVSATHRVSVSRSAFTASLNLARNLWVVDRPIELEVTTSTPRGEPVAAKGSLVLAREETPSRWLQENVLSQNKTSSQERLEDHETPHFQNDGSRKWFPDFTSTNWTKVQTLDATTDRDGRTSLTVNLAEPGRYRARWLGTDNLGFPVTAEEIFVVASKTAPWTLFDGRLEIHCDKDQVQTGDSILIMLRAPRPDAVVWLGLEAAGKLAESRVEVLRSGTRLLEIPVEETWAPGIRLLAASIEDGRIASATHSVEVTAQENRLKVAISPDASELEPGTTAEVRVTVTDAIGQPVESAEVTLSVYDAAADAIIEPFANDPFDTFFNRSTNWSVGLGPSILYRPTPSIRDQRTAAQWLPQARNQQTSVPRGAGRFEVNEPKNMAMITMQDAQEPQAPPSDGIKVSVRSDFRAAALFDTALLREGAATFPIQFPDSLTEWRLRAWASGIPARFGLGEGLVKTRIPLAARLVLPRFLVAGDVVTIGATLTNELSNTLETETALEVTRPLELAIQIPDQKSTQHLRATETLESGRTQRFDYVARAAAPGEAALRFTARADSFGDAIEKQLSIVPAGIEQVRGGTKCMDSDSTVLEDSFDLPEGSVGSASATLRMTSGYLPAAIASLDYLIDYPYNCIEQTLSRVTPAVLARNAAKRRHPATFNDAFKEAFLQKLQSKIPQTLESVETTQLTDGSWSWFAGGKSDAYMTAYAVWSLTLLEQSGITVPAPILQKARRFLLDNLDIDEDEGGYPLQAWILFCLTQRFVGDAAPKPERMEAQTAAFLWKNRDRLEVHTLALLTAVMARQGFSDEAGQLASMLINAANKAPVPGDDKEASRTFWGQPAGWLHWHEGPVETTAIALIALATAGADTAILDSGARWLLANRQDGKWFNTRDTAMATIALINLANLPDGLVQFQSADFSGLAVNLNGSPIAFDASKSTGFGRHEMILPAEALKAGVNRIQIRRSSAGTPVFVDLAVRYQSGEDGINASGNQLFIERNFEMMVRTPTLLADDTITYQPIDFNKPIIAGSRVRVKLRVTASLGLDHVMIQDFRAAGFEPVNKTSDEHIRIHQVPGDATPHSRTLHAQLENYERSTEVFIDHLPAGTWEIVYELLAELPGRLKALPARARTMYLPLISGNSTNSLLIVE